MTTKLQLSADRLITIESGPDTKKLAQFITENYMRAPGQPAPAPVTNVLPVGTPGVVAPQGDGELLVPLPLMNFDDDSRLAAHVRKQHAEMATNQWPEEAPMFAGDQPPLPVPTMDFAAPEPRQPRSAADLVTERGENQPAQSSFVGNFDADALRLPEMRF